MYHLNATLRFLLRALPVLQEEEDGNHRANISPLLFFLLIAVLLKGNHLFDCSPFVISTGEHEVGSQHRSNMLQFHSF